MIDTSKDVLKQRRLECLELLDETGATVILHPVVGGVVSRDYIAVTDCPPAALVAIVGKYRFTSLHDGVVLIPLAMGL